jgi:hypothetical protein
VLIFEIVVSAGGLAGAGALPHGWASSLWWTVLLEVLLLFAGVSEFIGLHRQNSVQGPVAWIAGAVSGARRIGGEPRVGHARQRCLVPNVTALQLRVARSQGSDWPSATSHMCSTNSLSAPAVCDFPS